MKALPDTGPIWSAWMNGGALVGARRPHTRVTVEPGYQLHTTTTAGNYTKVPVRWYQRADNTQTETEIPGVRQVQTGYDIDQDTGSCVITLVNQFLDPDYTTWNDANGDWAQPGYLTPDRGSRPNPWGFEPNDWAGILTRNALIRTYQGYGGHGMSIADAKTAGHLVLTGVWLVDQPVIATGQSFVLNCRGMGKLLVDQQVYPDLVPASYYPLSYQRFFTIDTDNPLIVYGHLAVDPHYRVLSIQNDPTDGIGYWLCGTDGGVFTYGQIKFHGSLGDAITASNTPGAYPAEGVTSMASTESGDGYWLTNDLGQVYSFGDATYHGGTYQPGAPDHPIIAIERAGTGGGYWLCADNGAIFSFGSAGYHGGNPSLGGHKIVDMASTPTGLGYWMVADNGGVFSFGDAGFYGSQAGTTLDAPITAMCPTPSGAGYYLVGQDGGVFTHGDAVFRGSVPGIGLPVTIPDGETQVGSMEIYSILDEFAASDVGRTVTSDALPTSTTVTVYHGPTHITVSANATATHTFDTDGGVSVQVYREVVLNDPMSDIIVAADNSGYWLAAEDGGVFAFNVPFMGSMPGQSDYFSQIPGNYLDYTDIIKDLAMWAGFHLYDDGATGQVYGNLELTGAYAGINGDTTADIIDATVFDKKPVIDPMHTIKETVGYVLYVGDEGELHFHEPNFWQSGNYLGDSTHTDYIPVVDERVHLANYTVSLPDADLRSQIIISSDDPIPDTGGPAVPGTVTTTYTPASAPELRGMVKPAMFVNQIFIDPEEQSIMAELISLHIYFRSRLGSLNMLANPMLQINDQIQILERETFETNTHYVRAINTTHDLKTGSYMSNLTTNVLSPPGAWEVVRPDGTPSGTIIANRIV